MTSVSNEDLSRAIEHLPGADDPILIVLKAHLLIEELLNRLVTNRLYQPDHFDSANITSFYVLQRIARSCPPEKLDVDEMWNAIGELNRVRNSLVHDLEPEDVDGEIQRMLDTWPPDAFETEISDDRNQTGQLRSCLAHLYGAVANVVTLVEAEDLDWETAE